MRSEPNLATATEKAIVSVIIPTLNCADLLPACLESVIHQTYESIELIIVDDYSSDGTPDIARRFGAKVLRHGRGQVAPFAGAFEVPIQQNHGVSLCEGEFIYLVDSDMRLAPKIVEQCVKKMNEGADAVIVPEVSIGTGFWAQCKTVEKTGYFGDSLESPRFLGRKAWDQINGLDPAVGGFYDWDLTDRLKLKGFRIERINLAVLHDEGKLTLRKVIKKKFVYGKYLPKYLAKEKDSASVARASFIPRLSPWRLFHYLRFAQVRRYPHFLIGLVVMKTTELFALLAGAVVGALSRREDSEVVVPGYSEPLTAIPKG